MNHYFKHICLLLLVTQISACAQNHSNGISIPSKECIELNNKGVEYLSKFPSNGKDIDTAINLLEQAVTCDPTYAIAYTNLANAYDRKDSYNEEIIILNKELSLTDNAAPILLQKGIIFDKKNDIDSAEKMYYLAKIGFEKRLAKKPDNIDEINNFILSVALSDGKDQALKELMKRIQSYPNLANQLSNKIEYYKTFDRRTYISEYNRVTELK
jgi:tetratricopeptide (TPR) repeat protein